MQDLNKAGMMQASLISESATTPASSPEKGKDALRPCPLCGGARIVGREVFDRYWLECLDCGRRTHNHFNSPQAAIDEWQAGECSDAGKLNQ